MKFFFDRCVPIALARMASALEAKCHVITHHDEDDRFCTTTTDVEWLRIVGSDRPRPIVLSGDGRILKKRDEISALREQGLSFFLLGEDFERMPARLQAWKFFKAWDEIIRACDKLKEASIFKVCTGTSQKVEFQKFTRDLASR